MKDYFRRLAEGYESGLGSKVVLPILDVAACAYGAASGTTRNFYEKNVLKSRKFPFPVISIGNLTWGGTGKTPLVEYVARRISERQRTPLILTRGYGKDEVEQYKQHMPRVVIGVGKNRVQVADELAQKQKIDAAILDDGMQHWPIRRDFEIVTLSALNPFGNGKLIPRGILREPVDQLRRASAVVITHSDLIPAKELQELKDKVHTKAPNAVIAEAYLEPLFFYRARKKVRVPLNKLQKQKVTTFSGLGSPKSFRLLLGKMQIKAVRNFEFGDHHEFTEAELKEIKEVSDSAYIEEIVTTEKDFYRNPALITEVLNPLVLATRMRIHSGEEEFNRRLLRVVEEVRS